MQPIKIYVDTTTEEQTLTLPALDETLISEGQQVEVIDASGNAQTHHIIINTRGEDTMAEAGADNASGTQASIQVNGGVIVFTAGDNYQWQYTYYGVKAV